jgi:hypothetical protein
VTQTDGQTSTSETLQTTGDLSEADAWVALLGLDGADTFTNDGYVDPFLLASSPSAGELYSAAVDFPLSFSPGPSISHTRVRRATDLNIDPALVGSIQWPPSSSTAELSGDTRQPWMPRITSIESEPCPVGISDARLSSLESSLGGGQRHRPTRWALRLFLGTYFDVFNIHLPLLHAPSFDFEHQPRGLLLAMAAIGALHRLEHRSAAILYRSADEAAPAGAYPVQTTSFSRGPGSMPPGPNAYGKGQCLAYYQTRLLLQYFGIFGEDSELAQRSLGMIAELAVTVRAQSGPSRSRGLRKH